MNASLERAKQQYLESQVSSASPERLVTMLYDRLLVDIDRGLAAINAQQFDAASTHLTHAQQIVAELTSSLTDAWDGADGLRSLYVFVSGRLILANVTRSAEVAAECRALIAPLRDAWHQAAALLEQRQTSAVPART